MSLYAYNNTSSTQTWMGKVVTSHNYAFIEESKYIAWANDDNVIASLGDTSLLISTSQASSGHIDSISLALQTLRQTSPTDSDGAPLSRIKVTSEGWHYQLHALEITTSLVGGYYNKTAAGVDFGFVTIRHYDSDNNLLTTQLQLDTSCVRTEVDWEPIWDYELIGGSVYQTTTPTSDIRLYVTAVPDVPLAYGGSVAFASGGINLKYVDMSQTIEVDGRSTKKLSYSTTLHTNKLRLTLTHPTSHQHGVMFIFQLFKMTGV